MDYKAVIFDYDGVFFPDEYAGIRTICLDEVVVEKIEKKYYTREDSSPFWEELRRYFDLTFSNTEFIEKYNQEEEAQRLHEQKVINLAKRLSETFSLAILSNQIADRTKYLYKNKDFSIFNRVFFSSEIGLKKPDPKIYHFAARELNLDLGECVFIDDMNENIEAAQSEGMFSIQFQSVSKLENETVLQKWF